MQKIQYNYSRITSSSAHYLVSNHYDLPEVTHCSLYAPGLHDNYLIRCGQIKYILRVYRNDWRTLEEINFELELLAFLDAENASVAAPVPTKSRESSFAIEGPEGKRSAALFYYANGDAPGANISVAQSALLGKTVANVHQLSDSLEQAYTRQELDAAYLLDESVLAIEPYLDSGQKQYITLLQNKLKHALPSLVREIGIYGICHGDVNPTNFNITKKNEITLFDFDQCGYGFRAFEIGKFISSIHPGKNKDSIAQAFIDGYQQVRPLSRNEQDAVPCFEIISVLWVMAIHVYNIDHIGHKYLEKHFWERRLVVLKELESRYQKLEQR